jgi:hypothetical protein
MRWNLDWEADDQPSLPNASQAESWTVTSQTCFGLLWGTLVCLLIVAVLNAIRVKKLLSRQQP